MAKRRHRFLALCATAVILLVVLSGRHPLPGTAPAALPTLAYLPLPSEVPLLNAPQTSDPVAAESEPPVDTPPVSEPVAGRMIIQFDAATTESEKSAYLEQLGAVDVQTIPALNRVVVQLPENTTLPDSPLVISEPDYYVQAQEVAAPNDPLYAQQWSLAAIHAPSAWVRLPANPPAVTVAVIDSGICATHPDLAGRSVGGWNFVNDNALVDDTFGHGCAVSGILAAQMNNAAGIAGLAPNAMILPLRVLDERGVGRYSDVAAAIVYAVDHNASVINLSLGGSQPSALLASAVQYASDHHVPIVAAAGNGGTSSQLYPAAYPSVIAVGSVDSDLQRSSFSNYGAGVDVYAPGRDILTTRRDGIYGRFSGTSFAAPLVAGALVLSQATGQSLDLNGGVLSLAVPGENPVDATPPPHDTTPNEPARAVIDADVYAALQQDGQAHVMIALALPASAQSDAADNTPAIAQAQGDVLAQLAPDEFVLAQQYVTVPALAGTIYPAAVADLTRIPGVARVYIDQPTEAATVHSVTAINAYDVQSGAVNSMNLTGAGITVAVLDSGIDMTNPAVSDDVVAQKCFSSTSGCPGNLPEADIAPDSSLHGTNISAIITAPDGVAPDANIVAIRVLDDYGRGLSSDWVAALDWIVAQNLASGQHVDVVNMSLGSTRLYKPAPGSSLGSCSQVFPAEAIAVQNVLALGIPVFAASGNQGSIDSINSPACIDGVIAVGAIYDSDLGAEPDTGTYRGQLQGSWPGCADATTTNGKITCFTNSNTWLDIVAPGAQIIIGGTGGSGTSQASPHAAGTAALMLQGNRQDSTPSDASPAIIQAILRSTGALTTDPRNGLIFRQLDALQAVEQMVDPIEFNTCHTGEITGISSSECEALLAIFYGMNGANWLNRTDWIEVNTPCTWYGVTCTGTHVTGLALPFNNLKGTIPPEITGLEYLQILDLSNNALITGGVGNIGGLTQLLELDLDNLGGLSGGFPVQLTKLDKLVTLSMTSVNLTGVLPPETGNMAALQTLDLSSPNPTFRNLLTGPLPATLNNLHQLRILNLGDNDITGPIPNLGALTLLDTLDLSENQLSGAIPASVAALPNLTYLALFENQLTGSLPTTWSTSIQYLLLYDNQLSGTLPNFSTLNTLVRASFSWNQFTGAVPAFSTTAPLLDELAFGHNHLTTIPTGIGGYPALSQLDLSYNDFTTLPTGITNLTTLTRLDLSHNHFGSLPANIGNLTAATTFDVNYNWLTTLPASIINLPGDVSVCYNRIDAATQLPAVVTFLNSQATYCGGTPPDWDDYQVIAPSNFAATVVSSNAVKLTWTKSPLSLLKYELYYAPVGGTLKLNGYVWHADTPPAEYVVTGLQPNTAYQFAIRSIAGIDVTNDQNNMTSVMSAPITTPATPANTCSAATLQGISLAECIALQAVYNSTGGSTTWNNNIPKDRWLHVDNPRVLMYNFGYAAYLGDVNTGGVVTNFIGHTGPIYEAGFNPTGTEVITAAADHTVRIWNPSTGAQLMLLDVPNVNNSAFSNYVYKAVYNPAGTRIATVSSDGTLRLYNRATGVKLWSVPIVGTMNDYRSSNRMQFTPDGTKILIEQTSGGAKLVDVTDGAQIRVFLDPGHPIQDAVLSPDGTRVVTADNDGKLRIWDASNANLLNTVAVGSATEVAYEVHYSPDGTKLLAYTYDNITFRLHMFQTSNFAELWQYDTVENSRGNGFIPDGTRVFSIIRNVALNRLEIAYFNPTTGAIVQQLPALANVKNDGNIVPVGGMAYSPTQTLPVAMYPCSWTGVTCSGGHVTGLDLHGINARGSIPPQINGLTFLQTLSLNNNYLINGVPPELGSMTSLTSLDLSFGFSQFHTLPPEIGNLINLQSLNLNTAYLTGSLPTTLGNLSNLKTLDLANNGNLTGTFPTSLGNLAKLEVLDISNNWGITGSFPAWVYNLTNLKQLYIADVGGLSGPITPVPDNKLKNLVTLDLTRTPFTGGIPASFSKLTNLVTLRVTENANLTGRIPPELGTLSKLETLDLWANRLTGMIPAELGNLSALKILRLAANYTLSGNIPPQLGNLHQLTSLQLDINSLTGTIPTTLNGTNLPLLTVLDLSTNQLTGEVPAQILTLTGVTLPGFRENALLASNPAVRTYLDTLATGWYQSQNSKPQNVELLDATSGTATLRWQPYCDDAATTSTNECNTNVYHFDVLCSLVSGGGYSLAGSTASTAEKQLTITGLPANSRLYCVVRSVGTYGTPLIEWYSPNSDEVTVITPAPFGLEVNVPTVPAIYEVDVPESENPEEYGDVCSENTARAVSFHESGRAVSFRGSGRAVSFRGSGDAGQVIFASTEGSEFDTVLTVWRVPANPNSNIITPFTEANAEFVTCNDNSPFYGSEPGDPDGTERPPNSPAYSSYVVVPFDRDYDLYFVVYARNEEDGGLVFSLDNIEPIIGLPADQIQALASLYGATGGLGWTNHTGWFTDTDPCTWYGITCTSGNVTGLNLAGNKLSGTIPADISGFTALTSLQLQNNVLRGAIPASFTSLTALSTLDIGYNTLSASGAPLVSFLNSHDSDWAATQTVPPTNVQVGVISNDSANITFTPIAYTGNGGYYDSACKLDPDSLLYAVNSHTANKSATSLLLDNLLPGTTYYCTLRTFTPAHGGQTNDLISAQSSEVSFTTSVPGWLNGGNGVYTLPPAPPFPLIFTMHTDALPSAYPSDLPMPTCGAAVGRAVSFRGSGSIYAGANTDGSDFANTVSIWSVPVGAPKSSATQLDCADSRNQDTYAGAAIPAGLEYLIIVAGDYQTGGELALVVKNAPEVPAAAANTYTLVEDTSLTVNMPGVLENDSNLSNLPLTLSVTTQPLHGAVTLAQNGAFVYTPALNYNGSDSFIYTINDGTHSPSNATVTLTISAVQDVPLTTNDTPLIPQNVPTIISVLANDVEPDGEALTLANVTNGAHGTAVNNGNGTLTYTPASGYIGSDTLTYKACDPHSACTGATVNLMVRPITGTITTLTFAVTGSADMMNEDGARLDGERASLWIGNGSSTSYLGLRFANVLIPPDAVMTSAVLQVYSPLNQDSPLSLLIAAEATDDSAPFSVTTPPSRRPATTARTSATINAAWNTNWQTVGNVSALMNELVARPGWHTGNDVTLLIRGVGMARQRRLLSSVGDFAPRLVVTFTYPDANLPPVARDDLNRTEQNTPVIIPVLANDSDPYNDVLSLSSIGTALHGGTVNNGNGTLTYTPTTGFIGTDTFTYSVCDPAAACDTGTVTVQVVPAAGVPTTLTFAITAAPDDVNQDSSQFLPNLSALWLGHSASGRPITLGLRFNDTLIPPGSVITSARLEVYSPLAQSETVNLVLAAEASDDSMPFTLSALPALRPLSPAQVSAAINTTWNAATWQVVSTNLAPMIQSVTDRPGWQYSRSLSLIVRGSGTPGDRRLLTSADGNPAFAPRLVIDFVPAAMGALSLDMESEPVLDTAPVTGGDVSLPADPFADALAIATDEPTPDATTAPTDEPVIMPSDTPIPTETPAPTEIPATDMPTATDVPATDVPAATEEPPLATQEAAP